MEASWVAPAALVLFLLLRIRQENRIGNIDRNFQTCGKRAQKTGDEFRRVNASTRPILFFLIMDRRRALNVRLLPEYDCEIEVYSENYTALVYPYLPVRRDR